MVPTLLSMLFFLLTCFSFSTICSSASQVSYKHHCASVVPASDPRNFTSKFFPLGRVQTAYYTGGGRILGFNSNWKQNSFLLRTRYLRATDVVGLFKLSGSISISSTSPYYYEGNSSHDGLLYYRPQSHRSYGRPSVTIRLDGFWSESTGKVCMVGSGTGYSKGGKALHLDAVFKLNDVFNSINISSLVSGSLESLNTEEEESYFEPFSVLMLPQFSYKFILDSKEAKDKLFPAESDDDDAEKGLSKSMFSFCSFDASRAIRKLHLEYSSDCNSPQNCTPLSGISGYFPSFMSLKVIDCPVVRKNQMRVLMKFENSSYEDFNTQAFDPKMTLVGEGWWDEKKNSLSVVACHLLGLESSSSSLASAHMGDCSVRLRLRFPSIWSIKDTLATVGHIWSNKTVKDPGYFKGITFTKEDDRKMLVRGLKYEYTQLDRVKNLCPRQKTVRNKGKRYLSPYSSNMRFDMSVRDSYRKVAWGHSSPLFVGDRFYSNGMQFYMVSEASSSNSSRVVAADKSSNSDLFNISYKISMSLLPVFALRDSNSLFSKSFEAVKISAEGVYDVGTGSLCMVGCRNLPSQSNGIPMAHSVDCEILLKFQFPPLYTSHARYIEGTIESLRKKSDPLYFRRLGLTSAAYYREAAKRTVQRKDMEIILVLISNTLAGVFVGFQLYHVKKNPKVLPFISLIMLSFLTLNHMVPLVLNFDALFTRTRNTKNFVLSNVAWLETNEIVVRLITMAAFLMQFRLLQLTWYARNNSDGSKKSLWVSEKEAVFVTLPLYAAGFLVTMMMKWRKINDGDWVQMSSEYQQTSSWEVLKSYGGLVLDGFLLPQILMNMFSNMRENALCLPFYLGTSLVRLLPHAYDLYRMCNYGRQYDGSYLYADPSANFYSTAWDIAIPLGGLLFAAIIYLQQRFGGSCILPYRFKSKVYEKVPVVNEAEEGEGEAEEEEEEEERTPKI